MLLFLSLLYGIVLSIKTHLLSILYSLDPRGFMKCSSLIQSLLDTMTSLWRRRRSTHAAIYNNDLKASEILIQSLSQVLHNACGIITTVKLYYHYHCIGWMDTKTFVLCQ